MRRTLVFLAVLGLTWLPSAWAAHSDNPAVLVKEAVTALGGAEALGKLYTLTIKGQVRQWEPEQSVEAGKEFRLAGDSTYEQSRDFRRQAVRTNWVRKLVYPAPREYTFSETLADNIGYVQGIDSTGRTKQSLEANPPAHTMSGVRVAATWRELLRTSPLLLLEMHNNPQKLGKVAEPMVDGIRLPAVSYQAGSVQFIVMFDPATNLPMRVRTEDHDNLYGHSHFDVTLSDWRPVEGVKMAHWLVYTLNGKVVAQMQHNDITVNPTLAADLFAIPEPLKATAARAATGEVPYQWVIRRQYIGTYLDSDKVNFDPSASAGLRLEEAAPGVQHVVGGTHNSLVVEMDKYLIVFDAPINDWQSRWTMDAAKAKYPGKPIQYLVLTHHHMDHTGGTGAYVAAGATVVVGAGNAEHFRTLMATPAARPRGAKAKQGKAQQAKAVKIIEVADRYTLSAGKREVEVYNIDNPHAAGMLIGYVKDARLGFVTDLWSPGRDKIGEKLTPGQEAVVKAVTKLGLAPDKFAGGHGTVANYADLTAVAGKVN